MVDANQQPTQNPFSVLPPPPNTSPIEYDQFFGVLLPSVPDTDPHNPTHPKKNVGYSNNNN